ncbi:MAG: tetratricopeptide repeat protein [Myxococcales bacterium]|nr:tetratricopeptide repeat protein [Myxococcales bacterium]
MPTDPFSELAQTLARDPRRRVDLARAALWLAADFRADTTPDPWLAQLDALADLARPTVLRAWSDEARVRALNQFLFDEQGFKGNREQYEDPRNSLLPDVLERRVGIPISLSLVYLEVAGRLGLPAEGIGFPGHFLVRYRGRQEDQMIDAFRGTVLDEPQLRGLLREALGEAAVLRRAEFQPIRSRDFLVRLVSNLKRHYAQARELDSALQCCERLIQLLPDEPGEVRDRGLLYEALECWDAARTDLRHFLAVCPDDPSAAKIRERLETLDGRESTLH